jgi:hypothetical protein
LLLQWLWASQKEFFLLSSFFTSAKKGIATAIFIVVPCPVFLKKKKIVKINKKKEATGN